MDTVLVRSVWALQVRQRQVVALRVLMDQSTEETARILSIARGTVKAHPHRALTTLRADLVAAGFKKTTDA